MNILELQRRAITVPKPGYTGEWAVLTFRPDLGSQQEFIVGVVAAIGDDCALHFKWLPTLAKLSALYGDALVTTDAAELLRGAENAIRASFRHSLDKLDTATPHISLNRCGYFACDDIEPELGALLKRQSAAIWQEILQ